MKKKNGRGVVNLIFKKHKIDEDSFGDENKGSLSQLDNIDQVIPVGKSRLSSDEIDSNLMDIYSDNGNIPDFKTIKIKKKRSSLVSSIYFLFVIIVSSFLIYWISDYIKANKDASSVFDIKIVSPDKVVLGEDFFYEIEYKNSSNYVLNNVKIELNYPHNFILSEIYSIDNFYDNRIWEFESLAANIGGKIKIRGKIINQEGLNNLIAVKSSYEIKGLSSGFSKENFSSVTVSSLPFKIFPDYFSTVLVGEEYPLKIDINNFTIEKMDSFIIDFFGSEFLLISDNNKIFSSTDYEGVAVEKLGSSSYKINLNKNDNFSLNFKYKINKKNEDYEMLSWRMKYVDEDDKEFVFAEKALPLEIIKSDLHLSMSANDKLSDFPVNFGERLDYVIRYSNKGDKNMKDLVIMAVFEGDLLNFGSLDDKNGGKISRRTISWTSREVPELKELEIGQSGEIKFSVSVSDFKKIDSRQKLEIKSYAQFSVGNIEEFSDEGNRFTDNRSNIILNNLNSNLTIDESVLYFNEDNIPVGSGPLPPAVGEKTTFRYYWTIKNSLHELRDVKIELPLPTYMVWEASYNISAGNLIFNLEENKIIWSINRWPLGVDKIIAEFNVSVIPVDSEYNKIIILSSGANLEATDIETGAIIHKKTDVKTSKLEDDVIASFSNDGRVR